MDASGVARTALARRRRGARAPAGLAAQTPRVPDRDRAAAAAKRTEDRLRGLQREADALAAQERTAARRPAEARARAADQRRAAGERSSASAPTSSSKLDAAEARAAALAQTAAAQLPDVEARLEQLYKMGRAGYWRLLLNVDDLQALGRAYRTASTLTEIDRARVQRALRHARCAGARAQGAAGARREIAGLQAEAAPRPRRRRQGGRGPNGAGRLHRRPPRPERAAGRASSRRPSRSCSRRSRRWSAGRGRRGHAAAVAAVPGRPALAGAGARASALRPPADQPFRHRHRQKRHGDRGRGGSAGPEHPRGNASRLPISSRATATSSSSITAPGPIRSTATSAPSGPTAASASTPRRRWDRRAEPRRQPCAVLRVTRRRGGRRSLTMAEEAALISAVAILSHMTSKTRLSILLVSTPVLAFVIVGGLIGQERSVRRPRVPPPAGLRRRRAAGDVELRRRREGRQARWKARCAGLADGLDPDSAYLDAKQVQAGRSGEALPDGDVGHRADAAVLPARDRRARRLARREGRAADRRLRPRHRQQADPRHVGVRGCAPAAGAPRDRRSR